MKYFHFKNRFIAKLLVRVPFLARRSVAAYHPPESGEIPWTPVTKKLRESIIALVTTAGVHHRDQKPFDMEDPNGDPSSRAIRSTRFSAGLMITHDYYDHADADRDINIVFPVDRLREFQQEGLIGKLADTHYGFMGHIKKPHLSVLISKTAPEVSQLLKAAGVDIVLLTPG
ncbi:MAG TPA: glycine/sarcosine/betaine reductase selenoprotein B family protein [Thermodesulfovibrionales bacterium]|nr:glycine/sarcosine/betaine reductase selenoprotein B family protein [Thermodesulfovibrionales bacterium]